MTPTPSFEGFGSCLLLSLFIVACGLLAGFIAAAIL